jgi:competence protein ComEA
MDPTATPWRVLDDPGQRAPAEPVATDPLRSRSAVLMVGAAALAGMTAFLLAFGAGASGTVVLDGGVPLSSGALVGGEVGADPSVVSDASELVVEIVGAVERPGVFRLGAGARVGDLLDAAGGYGARVDTDRASRELNLAAPLHDGEQIRVPSRDDPVGAGQPGPVNGGAGAGSGAASGPLDLNLATGAELEALPGIGPVTAGKILASREEQAFATAEDLRTRKLVGEKTFEKLRDLVTVR